MTTLSFGSVVIESNLRGVEQEQEEFSLKFGVDDGVWACQALVPTAQVRSGLSPSLLLP